MQWQHMVIFIFFVLLGTSSLKYSQKANSQQGSDLAHSFVHCRIFPQLPVCSYTVVFSEFSGKLLLWNTNLCVFGCPLIWCTSETAHPALWFWCIYALVLERDSKFPSCVWNLHYQQVNFKVLRDSQWVQQRLSISLYLTPEYWVGMLL